MSAPLFLAAGLLLVLAINADFLQSTLTTRGAGLLTRGVGRIVWSFLSLFGDPKRSGYLSALAGPIVLVAAASIWIAGLWIGWTLIFMSGDSLADTTTSAVVDASERLSFIGISLSTLGVGLMRPTHGLWHFLTALVALNGMIVLTLSVSYLINVLTTVLEGRSVASRISSLGDDAVEIVRDGWTGSDFEPLKERLSSISPDVASYVHHMDAFTIAAYFGHHDEKRRPVTALSRLGDILFCLSRVVAPHARPHKFLLSELGSTLETASLDHEIEAPRSSDLRELATQLRVAGIPTIFDVDGERLVGFGPPAEGVHDRMAPDRERSVQ